jgi:hypothetical protein
MAICWIDRPWARNLWWGSKKKGPDDERRGQFREELREKSRARMTMPTLSRCGSSSQHKMEDFLCLI